MNDVVNETLLLAEDEPTIARRLKQILTAAGHRVAGIVTRSTDVADALAQHRPAVMLLDIAMETETAGLDLVESNVIPEDTSVVFVSARSDEATMQRVQRIAPAGFVVKPFTESQVLAAVRVALGQSRQGPAAPGDDLTRQLGLARGILTAIARELERAGPLVAVGQHSERSMRKLAELGTLSPREREILRELVQHKRPPTIARELFISHHTVRNHLKAIFAKLGVHSQAELLDKVLEPSQ